MPKDTVTITDNRTGKSYELPISYGTHPYYGSTIPTIELRKLKQGPEDFGLMGYDPAFMNTASCRSAITFIDGDKGILEYRGYPIEQLAEHSTFTEVAYLLLYGELPRFGVPIIYSRQVTAFLIFMFFATMPIRGIWNDSRRLMRFVMKDIEHGLIITEHRKHARWAAARRD